MITFEQAQNLANAQLQKLAAQSRGKAADLVILTDKVQERASGWVFPYNAKRFVEQKQPLAAVVATGPIFIDKESGTVHVLPSSRIAEWLETYDRTGAPPSKPTGWKFLGKGSPPNIKPAKGNMRIRKKT